MYSIGSNYGPSEYQIKKNLQPYTNLNLSLLSLLQFDMA